MKPMPKIKKDRKKEGHKIARCLQWCYEATSEGIERDRESRRRQEPRNFEPLRECVGCLHDMVERDVPGMVYSLILPDGDQLLEGSVDAPGEDPPGPALKAEAKGNRGFSDGLLVCPPLVFSVGSVRPTDCRDHLPVFVLYLTDPTDGVVRRMVSQTVGHDHLPVLIIYPTYPTD